MPDDVYLNLKNFKNGAELDVYINSLSMADLNAWRQRVVDTREAVLAHVSQAAFAASVNLALHFDL